MLANILNFAGPEARPGTVAWWHQGDGHGQDPPGECASGEGQVQDPEGNPQGQHQEAGRPVREHVKCESTPRQHTSLQPNSLHPTDTDYSPIWGARYLVILMIYMPDVSAVYVKCFVLYGYTGQFMFVVLYIDNNNITVLSANKCNHKQPSIIHFRST